jgi:hypothetical protein
MQPAVPAVPASLTAGALRSKRPIDRRFSRRRAAEQARRAKHPLHARVRCVAMRPRGVALVTVNAFVL